MAPEFLLLMCGADRRLPQGLAARIAHRLALDCIAQDSRYALLTAGRMQVYPLAHHGFIVGNLFRRFGAPELIATLSDREADQIVASGGRELIDRYWGGYVCMVQKPGGALVLRDPSGAQPCYHTISKEGYLVIASSADLLRRSGLSGCSIDWEELGRILLRVDLPSAATAIEGLSELLPGTRLDWDYGSVALRSLWSPWDYVTPRCETRADMQDRLRRTVQSSVSAWASSYRGILCAVSGGLDSSIVASCLPRAGRAHHLLTVSTADRDGDEATYARLLAAALRSDLVEERYDLDHVNIDRPTAPSLPRPLSRAQQQSFDAAVRQKAEALHSDCLFTGNGGDNVFALSRSATCIYDRFLATGIGRGMFQTLGDVCTLTGASPMQAMIAVAKIASRRTARYPWKPDRSFLHPNIVARDTATRPDHPWLEAPYGALPGKAVHIALLLRIQLHLAASAETMGLAVVNPLMSQPVVEQCLAVPSWEWCGAGLDRSVARQAFADQLPDAIIWRRSKGTPESFCLEIIAKHRRAIRDKLLGGVLAARGLLDVPALDRRLSDEAPTLTSKQRILELVEAEAWAHHWSSTTEDLHSDPALAVPARSVAQ
ncbi:asparagine synthase-related protein [Novosphingobium sp. BK626]|nr:asparagine synthase-related protein [Novosphingobium sp. BK626]